MTFVALPVLPAVALTVTRASTAPPHAIALGDPLANACEPVADGLTAAGATPLDAATKTVAVSAMNAPS